MAYVKSGTLLPRVSASTKQFVKQPKRIDAAFFAAAIDPRPGKLAGGRVGYAQDGVAQPAGKIRGIPASPVNTIRKGVGLGLGASDWADPWKSGLLSELPTAKRQVSVRQPVAPIAAVQQHGAYGPVQAGRARRDHRVHALEPGLQPDRQDRPGRGHAPIAAVQQQRISTWDTGWESDWTGGWQSDMTSNWPQRIGTKKRQASVKQPVGPMHAAKAPKIKGVPKSPVKMVTKKV